MAARARAIVIVMAIAHTDTVFARVVIAGMPVAEVLQCLAGVAGVLSRGTVTRAVTLAGTAVLAVVCFAGEEPQPTVVGKLASSVTVGATPSLIAGAHVAVTLRAHAASAMFAGVGLPVAVWHRVAAVVSFPAWIARAGVVSLAMAKTMLSVEFARMVVPVAEGDAFVAGLASPPIRTCAGVRKVPRARTRPSILARAIPVTEWYTVLAVCAGPSRIIAGTCVAATVGASTGPLVMARVVMPVAVWDRVVTRIATPTIVARASVLIAPVAFTIGVVTRVVMPVAVRNDFGAAGSS